MLYVRTMRAYKYQHTLWICWILDFCGGGKTIKQVESRIEDNNLVVKTESDMNCTLPLEPVMLQRGIILQWSGE